MDGTVRFYCSQEIAESTQKTYKAALSKFFLFYTSFDILSLFPVSEDILCYFTAYMASQQLTPQTVKTYLAGIRHMQIMLGLSEPRAFSSLPRLKLVQSGIGNECTHENGGLTQDQDASSAFSGQER